MLKTSHFKSQNGPNFTFPILMHGVAVSWTCTLYGTSTLALACLLVWSSGSTWLGLRPEGGKYFHFQAINSSFSTNCPLSQLMVLLQTSSPIECAPMISSSSMHSCSWSRCKYVVESFLAWQRPPFSALTLQPAELQGSTLCSPTPLPSTTLH